MMRCNFFFCLGLNCAAPFVNCSSPNPHKNCLMPADVSSSTYSAIYASTRSRRTRGTLRPPSPRTPGSRRCASCRRAFVLRRPSEWSSWQGRPFSHASQSSGTLPPAAATVSLWFMRTSSSAERALSAAPCADFSDFLRSRPRVCARSCTALWPASTACGAKAGTRAAMDAAKQAVPLTSALGSSMSCRTCGRKPGHAALQRSPRC
mmetsp:Transcript_114965/g.199305  ORF Transcript_114965/g.199305 Transcript_114965/m.199305 type:complete len:206 (+) Transcript_114965:81-698(+)